MRCYRKILHISYKDHVTNEEVRAKIQRAIGPHKNCNIMTGFSWGWRQTSRIYVFYCMFGRSQIWFTRNDPTPSWLATVTWMPAGHLPGRPGYCEEGKQA